MDADERARVLAGILAQEGLYEVSLDTGEERLRLRRRRLAAAGPVAAPPPPAPDFEELDEESLEELAAVPITSQVVGIVHLSDRRHGTLLARAGQRVRPGQILAYLESMGLDHEVRCPVEGDVLEILVHEGDPVEYGQALLVVQPI